MKSLSAKFVVILLLLVLAFGCSTLGGIGQPISTVIDRFGPPSRLIPDGKGGSVYIWEHWTYTGWGNYHLQSTTIWVDSNGIIYAWR